VPIAHSLEPANHQTCPFMKFMEAVGMKHSGTRMFAAKAASTPDLLDKFSK
jgi:hypothetical protein